MLRHVYCCRAYLTKNPKGSGKMDGQPHTQIVLTKTGLTARDSRATAIDAPDVLYRNEDPNSNCKKTTNTPFYSSLDHTNNSTNNTQQSFFLGVYTCCA